ncbi:MAG TPA: DegT/DnrJ/EryC1/StrS family aminotransferase [Blastocatellia bacterium]
MKPFLKKTLKAAARQSIGRLPQPPSRLTGKLAKDGGKAVRDTRFRPWADYHSDNLLTWILELRPALRKIFLTGSEGLPQSLAKEFAQRWAQYCGCRYGLLLPHGTDALRIALAAVLDLDGLEYGGEVIVPNFSFIATATSALDRRLSVVFVDVDPKTLLIDPARVEEAIKPGKTRAIMPVHLFGQPADMTALRSIADRHHLKIVEDAAQAHGAVWETGPVGSLGDAAGFSFQTYKNLSCGEGGALVTNDLEVFERAYSLHDVGRARSGGDRWGHITLGWNCRPTEYQAAVLIQRFKVFERQQKIRERNVDELRSVLTDVPCLQPIAIHPGTRRHGNHMFVMRYRSDLCGGLEMADFLTAVQAEGAPVYRAYNSTIANQPAIRKLAEKRPEYFRSLPTPEADRAVEEVIYVPQQIFLGPRSDMLELGAALAKVQRHYEPKAIGTPQVIRTEQEPAKTGSTGPVLAGPTGRRARAGNLRVGVIGVGLMGRIHCEAISSHAMLSLVGVTDVNRQARKSATRLDCRWFDTPDQMFSGGDVDAVVIATPHRQHAELSIAALRAGLHVICEKPLSVTVAQADAILDAARGAEGVFAVVHQSRFEPAYREAKRMLDSGELGPIMRCSMVETVWRSESYYKSGEWRGTWKGEGGGVLLNQAPHVLDRYAWLCGMPESVTALCSTALHDIEVEDSASAILGHVSGMHGTIHVSTNESPGVAETVIACDKGRLTIEDGILRVTRLSKAISQATRSESRYWGDIQGETRKMGGSLSSMHQLLGLFYENFALTTAGRAELLCPGVEGINAVEIANAMILSSMNRREVRFPVNRPAYDELIEELSVGSISAQGTTSTPEPVGLNARRPSGLV